MLALMLVVSSLFAATNPAQAEPPLANRDVLRFQKDVEEISDLRSQTSKFFYHIKNLAADVKSQPIPESDLKKLDLLNADHAKYAAELKTFVTAGKNKRASSLKSSDLASATTLTLELAAELTYIDSIYLVVSVFQQLPEIRVILNRADPTTGRPSDVLYQTMSAYYSVKYYNRREDLIHAFDKAKGAAEFSASPELSFLSQYIAQSDTYKHFESQSYFEHANEKAQMLTNYESLRLSHHQDNLGLYFTHKVVGGASKVFGNGVGSIQFRDGKLKGHTDISAKMRAILQPGDLLLEATPFRATSKFIPGHYGHVAMWVGTEAQLLNDDFKGVYQKMWAAGQTSINQQNAKYPARFPKDTVANAIAGQKTGAAILEALRPYVVMNTPEHFMDIDDLLILRPDPTRVSLEEIRNAIPEGMSHLGQPYDFNFDDQTNDQIVCSELALTAYRHVKFDQTFTLGRWTINPDNVATQGLQGMSFYPVMMVLDGKEIGDATKMDIALKTNDVQTATELKARLQGELKNALVSSKK
jgi:uncharacterized protein YycO